MRGAGRKIKGDNDCQRSERGGKRARDAEGGMRRTEAGAELLAVAAELLLAAEAAELLAAEAGAVGGDTAELLAVAAERGRGAVRGRGGRVRLLGRGRRVRLLGRGGRRRLLLLLGGHDKDSGRKGGGWATLSHDVTHTKSGGGPVAVFLTPPQLRIRRPGRLCRPFRRLRACAGHFNARAVQYTLRRRRPAPVSDICLRLAGCDGAAARLRPRWTQVDVVGRATTRCAAAARRRGGMPGLCQNGLWRAWTSLPILPLPRSGRLSPRGRPLTPLPGPCTAEIAACP